MSSRRALLATCALALALVTAGCSDDGGDDDGSGGGSGRPTTAELEAVLPTEGLDAAQIECMANAFVASEISDEGLRAIVDAGGVDDASGLSDPDATAVQEAASAALECSASQAEAPPVTG